MSQPAVIDPTQASHPNVSVFRPALFRSLDPKDRRMLLVLFALVIALFVLLAVFTPAEDANSNPVPSTYLSGAHGAKAAYTLLRQAGYSIGRWEQPLSQLAEQAGPGTVLILAEPASFSREDRRAVAAILGKGGRVLATGLRGGLILPGNGVTISRQASFAACEGRPEGLQPLATSGPIWIAPSAGWKGSDPETRIAYVCDGEPVVVEYSKERGHAVWWASSTPLENGSIERGKNLELLLNSIGSAQGKQIYWDESLHGYVTTAWDYVKGPVWPLFLSGAIGIALLVVFSYSRRSGPVRALPQAPRTTPIEFLDALGSLYRSTGAASTAVQIAWERFRAQAALLTGQRMLQVDAHTLTAAIERRFGSIAPDLEDDLVAAEEACCDDSLKSARALVLVRALRTHEETLRVAGSRPKIQQTPTDGQVLAPQISKATRAS
jgi:Domain of unknown function (DUF4350)